MAASLLGTSMVLVWALPRMADLAREGLVRIWSYLPNGETVHLPSVLRDVGGAYLLPLCAFLLALGVSPLMAAVAQSWGIWTAKPLAPDLGRLNPLANLGRILGWQGPLGLLKAAVKVAVVAWALWGLWPALTVGASTLALVEPAVSAQTLADLLVQLFRRAGFAFLGLAALDYGLERWRYLQKLKMTRQEVRQEMKQNEGDPLIRQRQRQIGRERVRKQQMAAVPKADVIIVNPIHIAVAIRYDPDRAAAPIILAMGQRLVADKIREIASAHDIPIVQNIPLARALFASAQVGQMIPAELFTAVAEVLATLLQSRPSYAARWGGET